VEVLGERFEVEARQVEAAEELFLSHSLERP